MSIVLFLAAGLAVAALTVLAAASSAGAESSLDRLEIRADQQPSARWLQRHHIRSRSAMAREPDC
jgi:hypothetical protein